VNCFKSEMKTKSRVQLKTGCAKAS